MKLGYSRHKICKCFHHSRYLLQHLIMLLHICLLGTDIRCVYGSISVLSSLFALIDQISPWDDLIRIIRTIQADTVLYHPNSI